MRSNSKLHSAAVSLFGLLMAVGCSDPEPEGPEDEPASWSLLAEELSGALFSIAGTAEDDVWVVGSNRGAGDGPTVLHWDGDEWSEPETGQTEGDLLWVTVAGDDVFAGGSEGTILRRDGDGFTAMDTPSNRTVWGVWGADSNDVWAVGGEPSATEGFIWHYDGDTWEVTDWAASDADVPVPPAWYKVWGTAADDVWFCGADGALMHYDGNVFEGADPATTRTLLTLHGRSDGSLVTAVGGQFTATLVASEEGAPFRDVTPEQTDQMFGVHHSDTEAYAVGMLSVVLHQKGEGAWKQEETDLTLFYDLHGVWIDPKGGVWAAGGQVVSPPYGEGALIYKGTNAPSEYSP